MNSTTDTNGMVDGMWPQNPDFVRGRVEEPIEVPECIESGEDCEGKTEFRMALSGTGRSFPRCDGHWSKRLDVQDGLNRRYPTHAPSDWSPMDAGESWDED